MAFARIGGTVFCLLLSVAACTTTSTQFVTASHDGGPTDPSGLPEVPAEQLGGKCSGFGTSIGDTVLFPSDMCPAGSCLVDARKGLELYCSADCEKARCPSGYLCQDTTVGGKRACFRDPNAPATPDGGTDSSKPVSFLDARLAAYKSGSSTKTDVALNDYADPSGSVRDLVIVLVDGAWSTYDNKQMQELDVATYSRVEILSVLYEGAMAGTGATAAEFSAWHSKYSHVDTAVDPELAQLGSGLGTITAVPTWFVFSARTMKQIATEQGYMPASMLASTIETWRAKAKN